MKLLTFSLNALAMVLFFNGCMTMGGSSRHGSNPESENRNRLLIKEKHAEEHTLIAEFPSSAVQNEVRFILEIKGPEPLTENLSGSVSLQIGKKINSGTESTLTELQPDRSLSTPSRFVFPYRFDEAGTYEVTFVINALSGGKAGNSHEISARIAVAEFYGSSHRPFTTTPWILGGSAVMAGMMVWMIIYF